MVNTKVLLLVPIVLAIAGISAYLVLGNSSQPSVASTTTSQQQSTVTSSTTVQGSKTSSTQTSQASSGQVKQITIRLTNDGFNGTNAFKLYLKQGDHVMINFIYEDKLGDFHPLYLTGYDLNGPTLSPQNTQGTLQFTADQTGKFGLICLNPNCKTHDKLVTAQVIVS